MNNDCPTPLGLLALSACQVGSQGIGWTGLRVYGRYAVVVILSGGGVFQDALGSDLTVESGDVIFVFPEVGHRYGPAGKGEWNEVFLVFEGPFADLLRVTHLLRLEGRSVEHGSRGEPG